MSSGGRGCEIEVTGVLLVILDWSSVVVLGLGRLARGEVGREGGSLVVCCSGGGGVVSLVMVVKRFLRWLR